LPAGKKRQPHLNALMSAPPRTPIIRPTLTYHEERLSFKVSFLYGDLWICWAQSGSKAQFYSFYICITATQFTTMPASFAQLKKSWVKGKDPAKQNDSNQSKKADSPSTISKQPLPLTLYLLPMLRSIL